MTDKTAPEQAGTEYWQYEVSKYDFSVPGAFIVRYSGPVAANGAGCHLYYFTTVNLTSEHGFMPVIGDSKSSERSLASH